jgi:dipeptide/tripeptide permease
MMGVWQLGTGFASATSGYLAKATSVGEGVTAPLATNHAFRQAFGIYGLAAVIVGCIAISLLPRFRAIMQLK